MATDCQLEGMSCALFLVVRLEEFGKVVGISGEEGQILVFWFIAGTAFVVIGQYAGVGNRVSGTTEVEFG